MAESVTARQSEYSQKLRDPRWQKMRLRIMERDKFTCQRCYDSESTLNVHHNYYRSNLDPWEYPVESLVTLCEPCHHEETGNRRSEEQALLEALKRMGFSHNNVNGLMSALYSAFGDNPTFPDNWDYYISRYLGHFHSIAPDVEEIVKERIAGRANNENHANEQ